MLLFWSARLEGRPYCRTESSARPREALGGGGGPKGSPYGWPALSANIVGYTDLL